MIKSSCSELPYVTCESMFTRTRISGVACDIHGIGFLIVPHSIHDALIENFRYLTCTHVAGKSG